MAKYLTIGEAAQRLGLEVDTVRRLEREGRIQAARTAGGHRRFLPEQIEQFLAECEGARKRGSAKVPPVRRRVAVPATTKVPAHHPARVTPDLDPEPVRVARAPRYPAPTPRTQAEPFLEFPRPLAKLEEKGADETRLTSIRNCGAASIPWDVPTHWRARAIADLERYVTAHEFPARLSHANAIEIVRARVQDFLTPWFRERDAQKAKQEAEQRCESLRSHGGSYALRETLDWDWEARTEARREVDLELKREVEADWDEREVEELVDEILDQWDDEEE